MAVEIIDLLQLVYEQKRRKVVLNTSRLQRECITIGIPARGMICIVTTRIRRLRHRR